MATKIVIMCHADTPMTTAPRRVGKLNFGIYCINDECREFIALGSRDTPEDFIFVADQPGSRQLVKCPFCAREQLFAPEEILVKTLSEGSRRRPRPLGMN